MIRIRLTEMMSEVSFRRGSRLDVLEVSKATGIHRTTLSRMRNQRGCNATLHNIDALCKFFNCEASDLIVYVPDESILDPVAA